METQIGDKELIVRVLEKDSKALEVLYDKYSPVLFTLINKIVGEKSKAENILSDIFVIIWQKSFLFNFETSNLYSWLVLLARNKSIDIVKREKGLITEEYNDDYENQFIIPHLSPEITPIDIDEVFSKRSTIFEAVNHLTEAQQYVLSLAYYEGLNENEIARQLNIPLLTVKTKLRVVLNSIKDNLNKETNQ